MKWKTERPSRNQLWGMSPSQFKTMLKRKGYKVGRDFFKQAAVAHKNNRAYRFRYWSFPEFFVDVSCPLNEFDRWANSTDRVLTFGDWIEK